MRRHAAAVVFAVLLAACGQGGQMIDAGAAPTRQAAAPSPVASPPAPTPSPAPPLEATAAPPDGDGATSAPTQTTTVSVYFTRGERVEPVTREVPRVARIGGAAIEQLLAGPAGAEVAAGYGTQIPAGTRLRGLTISDGVAVVDLSREFESGGGTLAVTLRLAQVACTLDAFPTVDGVRFAVEGEVVDVFSGDGVVVDEPVACTDYAAVPDAISPSTPSTDATR